MNHPLILKSCLLALAGLPVAFMPAAIASSYQVVHAERDSGQPLFAAKPADHEAEDPRTVRLTYFRPKDRPFRPEVVDRTKATILQIQAFFAEEMERHGHGSRTFRLETDDEGLPLVHLVEGEHADAHYLEKGGARREIWDALGQRPIEVIVLDFSTGSIPWYGGRQAGGVAARSYVEGQTFGNVRIPSTLSWRALVHELGHVFGLVHDFRDDEDIMSYGEGGRGRISACAAEVLAVHPYFDPDVDLAREPPTSTIDLISPSRYPAGSGSISIRVKVSDSAGLHQVLLFAVTEPPHFAAGGQEVKACSSLSGEQTAVVEFTYDGLIPSSGLTSLSNPIVHRMSVRSIDELGRASDHPFHLYQSSDRYLATLQEPGTLTSLAFSPGGGILASAAREAPIKLWDVGTGEIISRLEQFPIQSVAFSPDGATLASEHNGTVKLWDVATGTNTAILEGHPRNPGFSPPEEGLTALAFSPDGATLAAVSGDSTVILWDPATAMIRADLEHASWIYSVAFSPDGTRLASAEEDGMVNLWDPATGEHVAALGGHTAWISSLAFSPGGATLASASGDGLIKLWDLATGRDIATIDNTRSVRSLAFSPDGATLASASGSLVRLWDVGTRALVDSLGHGSSVRVVAFSPDGRTLASGVWEGVELWDAAEWLRPRPHELVMISGDGQEGSPGAALGDPLVVEVRDQYGNGVAGAPVTFVVTEGGGRLGGRFTIENTETDAEGRAVGVLTLGTSPGTTTVEARLLWADPVTFTATLIEAPLLPIGDGDPRKWHLPEGAALRLGKGRTPSGTLPLAFAPDGQRLAVPASIGTWLYDVSKASELALLPGGWIDSAAFSPDGTILATGTRDQTVLLWDVASGQHRATLHGHESQVHSIAFSPDGSVLACASPALVTVWDVASREKTATLDGHGGNVRFLHDGATLSVRSWNGLIKLWDTSRSPVEFLLQMQVGEGGSMPDSHVSLSPDGLTLAAASGDQINLWDVMAGTVVSTLEGGSRIFSVAYSPDGTTLAAGSSSSVKLWDTTSGRSITTFRGPGWAMDFSPDGATLAATSRKMITLWDVATGVEVATLNRPAYVGSVVFSPDGSTLASMTGEGILLWDMSTRNASLLHGYASGDINSLAYSPDGAMLAAASAGTTTLVDVVTGRDLASLQTTAEITSLAFSPDGAVLALGSHEDKVQLWNVATKAITTLQESSERVLSVAFSPDGATLAAGSLDGTVMVLDLAKRRSIATLDGHPRGVHSLAFSPDGAILAAGTRTGTAVLWDTGTWKVETALHRYSYEVSVAFSSDGASLATGSLNSSLQVLEVETWELIATLRGPSRGILSLAFSPDGARLAAGSRDGNLWLWDAETWGNVASLEGHGGEVESLAFSPDGSTLASGSRDGTLLLWDLTPRPHALAIVSGDAQQGRLGAPLPESLVVEVRDQNGEVLEGAQVAFTVTTGGGALTTETAITDSLGRAETALTLGSVPGPNTVEVSVGGVATVLFSATAAATPDFDGDGEVGFGDFFLFAEAFGGSDPRFDLDGSGSVDFADFFLFAEHFGQPARARLVAMARELIGLPDGPQLRQNAPNPFNSGTVISWFQLKPGPARVEVFALTGQRVAVLHEAPRKAGLHRLRWDGRDDRGRPLGSGVYVYRLVTAEAVQTRKLTLLQ